MSYEKQGMSSEELATRNGETHYSLLIAHYLPIMLIIVTYLTMGILYAAKIPPWETPDEPAHYNYIKYLAENYRFPVLRMGDYPHDYLEEIKARHFPP